ncbi:MAG TPA: SAM-dependent methyltransferase [Opitutaceae bacterium]|nr:SAM-dependent methyltransferase [Opitutaceae bacterium]
MVAAQEQFLRLLGESVAAHRLVKLTLGRYRGPDATLRNLHVRPVTLRAGPHLSFVWRHATRDLTANHPPAAALALLEPLIGGDFGSAHLFTTTQDAQLEFAADGSARLKLLPHAPAAPPSESHDRPKQRLIDAHSPWLHALGVTTAAGAPREGMAAKFKQINRFAELLAPLLKDASFPTDRPVEVADMGCGKGYLTFAVWQHLREQAGRDAHVRGIEQRPDLVDLCNRVARECACAGLEFAAGTIADTPPGPLDVLIALHACDTATDDAIAQGVAAGAGLIVVAPCCHKEISPQLAAPAALAPALRHGIFHERQAEFVTDALRTLLLEWAGYDTRAFEFISTEHTAKNLMIAAVRRPAVNLSKPPQPAVSRDAAAARVRALAAAYGVRHQRLAARLGFPLES